MMKLVCCALALVFVAVAHAGEPALENPLTEADDMLKHLDMMSGPEEHKDLGESTGEDEDEEGMFEIPTNDEALQDDENNKQRDAELEKELCRTMRTTNKGMRN